MTPKVIVREEQEGEVNSSKIPNSVANENEAEIDKGAIENEQQKAKGEGAGKNSESSSAKSHTNFGDRFNFKFNEAICTKSAKIAPFAFGSEVTSTTPTTSLFSEIQRKFEGKANPSIPIPNRLQKSKIHQRRRWQTNKMAFGSWNNPDISIAAKSENSFTPQIGTNKEQKRAVNDTNVPNPVVKQNEAEIKTKKDEEVVKDKLQSNADVGIDFGFKEQTNFGDKIFNFGAAKMVSNPTTSTKTATEALSSTPVTSTVLTPFSFDSTPAKANFGQFRFNGPKTDSTIFSASKEHSNVATKDATSTSIANLVNKNKNTLGSFLSTPSIPIGVKIQTTSTPKVSANSIFEKAVCGQSSELELTKDDTSGAVVDQNVFSTGSEMMDFEITLQSPRLFDSTNQNVFSFGPKPALTEANTQQKIFGSTPFTFSKPTMTTFRFGSESTINPVPFAFFNSLVKPAKDAVKGGLWLTNMLKGPNSVNNDAKEPKGAVIGIDLGTKNSR